MILPCDATCGCDADYGHIVDPDATRPLYIANPRLLEAAVRVLQRSTNPDSASDVVRRLYGPDVLQEATRLVQAEEK